MICLGNICRSPMAEVVLRALGTDAGLADLSVESFATSGYHVGEGADPGALAALARSGYRPHPHRARQATPGALAAVDLLLAADRPVLTAARRLVGASAGVPEVALLRRYDPAARPGDDEVPDPYAGGPAAFDACLRIIERSCQGLLAALSRPDR